ncbi:MAG TPA: cystathionine beta-lyase [Longimicrobiaceae bacterium]|nr:cystathionine beta-lyase [Longimicrobiaceae bacterium]
MKHWTTRLIHSDAQPAEGFRSLVTPVFRGSTTVFPRAADVTYDWRHEAGYTYGLYGTPTTRELAARVAELEGGEHTFVTPGGQAAITLIAFAFTGAGDHVLIPDSVYGPTRQLADDVLRRFGVDPEYYPPLAGAELEARMRPTTRLVWCESPGSVTMEVQDVPAIAEVAHRHGAVVALDNTYSAGVYFDAFAHGVDVTMQALTKYVGGHSDLLLGSVTVRTAAAYERLGVVHDRLGLAVSPDDCYLALRGMQTLGVRLAAQERSALAVARWLGARGAVASVLHPALPSCPGHAVWKRDFTGSTSVFSIVFAEGTAREAILAFVDALALFRIGFSWGGVHSLALPWHDLERTHGTPYGDRLVRFNVGLEDTDDLVADLDQALTRAGLAG